MRRALAWFLVGMGLAAILDRLVATEDDIAELTWRLEAIERWRRQ